MKKLGAPALKGPFTHHSKGKRSSPHIGAHCRWLPLVALLPVGWAAIWVAFRLFVKSYERTNCLLIESPLTEMN